MSFIFYDILMLVLFVIFVSIFLYINRKNLKREGLLFLYKAGWGIKLINYVGNKYKKTLKILSYVSVTLGYILMALAFYFVGKIVWVYAFYPQIVKAIKIPPITPLLPYITNIINVPGLPSFYFIYWILILAIVAISHEFSHGIFAIYNKVKIKSTGFGFFPFFLPVFLAAFVEQDDKQMIKKSNFSQRTILSAGTFANVLTGLFFVIIMGIFFSLAYTPVGVTFDSYAYSAIPVYSISMINGISVTNVSYENILSSLNSTILNNITTENGSYFLTKTFLEQQGNAGQYIYVYDNAPAVKAGLANNILDINDVKITSVEALATELNKYSPGDEIVIKAEQGGNVSIYNITLEENPENNSLPWLGIGFISQQGGVFSQLMNYISFKKMNVYYTPNFGDPAVFIYNFLWWLVLISFSVALINMLPVGIFDGGRFFYLTILAITKNEKRAKRAFDWITYFFLFILALVLVFWFMSLI